MVRFILSNLPVGPGVLGLCQPMVDVVLGASIFEGVRPNELSSLRGGLDVRSRRTRIAWRGEVGSVVGEDGMDLVRDGGDQALNLLLAEAPPSTCGNREIPWRCRHR
jgi:hypothetical protein